MEDSSVRDRPRFTSVKLSDIDEKIAALEREIDEEDDQSIDSDCDDNGEQDNIEEGLLVEKDSDGNVVRMLSVLNDDRIEPLPKRMLPVALYSKRVDINGKKNISETKKRVVQFKDDESQSKKPASSKIYSVQAYKDNYEPASMVGAPFWCRVCQWLGQDLNDFKSHSICVDHLSKLEIERKASSCKLCRKQFTSPLQLKEHLHGAAHKAKLQSFSSRTNKSFF